MKSNEKIRLAFLPQNKNYILHMLYPDRYTEDLFSVQRNSKVNTKIKSEALLNGEKIRYRVLSKEQVETLQQQTGNNITFAVFKNRKKSDGTIETFGEDKYNIAYKDGDAEQIERAIADQKKKWRR